MATVVCRGCGKDVDSRAIACSDCRTPVGYRGVAAVAASPEPPSIPPRLEVPPAGRRLTDEPFRPNVVPAILASLAIGMVAVLSFLTVLALQDRIDLVDRIFNRQRFTFDEAVRADGRIQDLTVIWVLAFLGSGVVYLVWFYRASKNLQALNVGGLRFGPAWAVWGHVIPFLNLWRPYEVLREIWRGSSPEALDSHETGDRSWLRTSMHPILGIWWGAWVIGGWIANAAIRIAAPNSEDLESIRTFDRVFIAFELYIMALGAMAIVVISLVTLRMVRAHESLLAVRRGAAAPFAVPPAAAVRPVAGATAAASAPEAPLLAPHVSSSTPSASEEVWRRPAPPSPPPPDSAGQEAAP